MAEWTPPGIALPARGQEVDAMDSGGHVQRLVYQDGLWFFPDFSMYVYYVPTFWRPIAPPNPGVPSKKGAPMPQPQGRRTHA